MLGWLIAGLVYIVSLWLAYRIGYIKKGRDIEKKKSKTKSKQLKVSARPNRSRRDLLERMLRKDL